MRNTFLGYSIIAMLNTVLIKTSSCRDKSVRTVATMTSNSTTLLVNFNEIELIEDNKHFMAVTSTNFSIVNDISRDFLYTTREMTKKARKSNRKRMSRDFKRNVSTSVGKDTGCVTNKMQQQTVNNSSHSIVNFKMRKKKSKVLCIVNSTYSSQGNGWNTTSPAFNHLSTSNEVDQNEHIMSKIYSSNVCTAVKIMRTRKKLSHMNASLVPKKRKKGHFGAINDTYLVTKSKGKPNKSSKSTTNKADHKPDVNLTSNDLKRKLLRQELIELLRNQSLLQQKKPPTRKKLFAKLETETPTISTPWIRSSRLSSIISTVSLFPPLDQNFLYSAEGKVDDSQQPQRSESVLNVFDEIHLNPEDSDTRRLDLQGSDRILYVPKNDSVKISSLNESTKKKRSNRPGMKISKVKSLNTTKSQVMRKRTPAPERLRKVRPQKPQKITSFDMYDFFLHQKPLQKMNLEKTAMQVQTKKKSRSTVFNFRQNDLNWNQFIESPEEPGMDIGPKIVFSASDEDVKQGMNSTITPDMMNVTLDLRELPDTRECERFWNHTFLTKRQNLLTLDQSQEICTLSSREAWHIIKHNFSHSLTTNSILSHLAPFHPLIHPFITKFDISILPNAKEARAIIAKLFNESVEVFDDYVATPAPDEITSVCPLRLLNEYDFADVSMSCEWKMLLDPGKWTTKKTTMTDMPLDIPDTGEAEHIFDQLNWPNLVKTCASRRNQPLTKPPRLSTLSLQESKLLLSRLGVELFGQQFRVNFDHANKKKNRKVFHSKSKGNVPGRVLKHRKLEGYVVGMITDPSISNDINELYVPGQSEESAVAGVQLNFNMKLFLSKLCLYLSDSKLKNETHNLPASKTPRRSFLIGKPAYFKKRKNALI